MYRFRNNVMNLIIMLCDCLVIFGSMYLANYIRHGHWMPEQYALSIAFMFIIAYVLIYLVVDLNRRIATNGYFAELMVCIEINIGVTALGIMINYFVRQVEVDFSRGMVGYFFVIDTLLMYAEHYCIKKLMERLSARNVNTRQLFIVCDDDNVAGLVDQIRAKNSWEYRIRGIAIMDRDKVGDKILDIPIEAKDRATLLEYCKSNIVDEMLIVTSNREIMDAVDEILSMGVTVHVGIKSLNLDFRGNSTVSMIGDQPAVTYANRFLSMRQAAAKRALDIVGGIVGSVITIFMTIFLGPLIKLESPGPVFFKQKRVGKNGRYFMMYKFRSMYVDAEERKKALMAENEMDGLMFKMENDPRVTKIGAFIRKTSLDEFPQFFNVLKGDMSLVGTRPPTVDEFLQYRSYHKMRLSIKPGITGLWQVSGRSNITDFEEIVKLDVQYINEWKFSLDLKILLQTIAVVFKHEGAK